MNPPVVGACLQAMGCRPRIACKQAPTARNRRRLLSLLLASLLTSSLAAAIAPDGARLYDQQCAKCHGSKGEGVKDKYADPLIGDWSVTKLTRYVAANMPEDDPETLSPAEAGAISRYLNDAFYSREAQARNHPVRVELAHLTNHQYLTTVADLLRRFERPDPAPSTERGLGAAYYGSAQRGRFESSQILYRGTDSAIDFDFSDSGDPTLERVGGLAEISGQWRGSIVADETGDYEFTLRTPNSLRVWINADIDAALPTETVLDVNVSTPESPDHRVTVRLLGGRAYPIRIDYWALRGKVGAPPPALSLRWKPPHGSERVIPTRNLSPIAVRPTFVLATHFPADDSSSGYERSGPVSKEWEEATTSAAFEVANYVTRKLDRLAGTRPSDPERATRVATFAEKFLAAAFRRPLSAEEKRHHVQDRFAAASEVEPALKRLVLFALKSPEFLYTELPAGPIDDGRIATRLAFALWDSAPDAALAQVAADGRLHTRREIVAQVDRMLADARTRAKLREFFHHWLQMRFVDDLRKDAALYPGFTPEIIDDLRVSLDLFLDQVMWSERSDFRELLRADYLWVNDRLAEFYGLPPPKSDEFAPVPVGSEPRAGVLTHPYLLAAFSYKSATSPIHRGVFLTRNIVGRSLKSPVVAQTFNEAEFTPGMTMREKIVKLTHSENCQGCHSVINPLGFSLEWFDAVGRYRTTDKGRAVDAAGEFLSDENETFPIKGPRDVAEFALASERANYAFIEKLFHHLVKQPVMAYGPQTLPALRDSFIASGYNLRKLVAEIALVAALHGVEPVPATTSRSPRS